MSHKPGNTDMPSVLITSASEIIEPKKLMEEKKIITQRIKGYYKAGLNTANRFEEFVTGAREDGSELTVSDFGFKELRKQIKNKNDEGIVRAFKSVISNMDDNKAMLEAKGYADEVKAAAIKLVGDLETDSMAQTQKEKSRMKHSPPRSSEFRSSCAQLSAGLASSFNL